MKAATMCEFSKQEFIGGLQGLGIDFLEKFCEKIPFMCMELKDDQKFREIYNFAFGWAKEKGQKSLALDTAIRMWQLLFAESSGHWLNTGASSYRLGITKQYLGTRGLNYWSLLGRWTLH
ncbi:hypothetical protein RGQ29_018605 [Quercus rubra]|uniref:Defective in cullin neddylation protein n=1 Tax=Quercus rubra TaxID=3512 RepID=A0AAN7FP67_QUERU|nr:hypothetical protein RGQ29_018605 [Quercus rubra]KAK4594935.1 hypothetical protein RGQ29_018605 [Quercus rubra]KAK4594936.1 hypothetical protein RGQ29_018605 [Quercus rubra]